MATAGISINVSSVLPDVIILDAGTRPPTFWIIEAVPAISGSSPPSITEFPRLGSACRH